MIQYLLCLIFPVISYSLQTYPRVFNRYFGVDVWTLLIEAKLVRENHHRIPMGKITSGFIFDGYFDYPPIYILFLSLFSEKKLFQLQGFISPFLMYILYYIKKRRNENLKLFLLQGFISPFFVVIQNFVNFL